MMMAILCMLCGEIIRKISFFSLLLPWIFIEYSMSSMYLLERFSFRCISIACRMDAAKTFSNFLKYVHLVDFRAESFHHHLNILIVNAWNGFLLDFFRFEKLNENKQTKEKINFLLVYSFIPLIATVVVVVVVFSFARVIKIYIRLFFAL